MDNQTQKKPVTAVRRGITGAIAGEVVMIVIFILVAASGAQVSFAYALIYLLFGPIYGFGFTFANWRLVAEKTKRGAVEGGAVLGIGIQLFTQHAHALHIFRLGGDAKDILVGRR